MAGNIRRRVTQGDVWSPSAALHNYLLDAAAQTNGPARRGGSASDPDRFGAVILVRNATGSAADAFTPLTVDVPVILPSEDVDQFRQQVLFDGIDLTADRPFCVLLENLGEDEIGRAVLSGVVPVQVTDAGDFATVVAGVLTGSDEASGCEVLWRASGSGPQWAVVRLAGRGGDACPPVWILSLHGAVTGGTAAFPLTLDGTTELIEFPHDVTASAVSLLIQGHSKYGTAGTPTLTGASGGALDQRNIHLRWSSPIEAPAVNSEGLEGEAGCAVRMDSAGNGGSESGSAYDAADLLLALLGVDGPGSGLDADSIDGVQAADLLQTSSLGVDVQAHSDTLDDVAAALNTSEMIAALGLGDAAALDADADGTLAANSDTVVPTQKAVVTYVAAQFAALATVATTGDYGDLANAPTDPLQFFEIDCSADPNYPAADRGHTYRVSAAGHIGGASGPAVTVGELLICNADGTLSGDHAAVGSAWYTLAGSSNAGDVSVTPSGNLTSTNTQAALVELQGDIDAKTTLSGVSETETNLGTFTGTTIADSRTIKAALQDLETALETKGTGNVSDGGTLATGLTFPAAGLKLKDTDASHSLTVSAGSNLTAARTLTLTTGDADRTLDLSAGSVTITAAGNALTSAADAAAQKATLSVDDLVTLSGVADGATHLGTFTGGTIDDNSTVKAALQALETAVDNASPSLSADKSALAATSTSVTDSWSEVHHLDLPADGTYLVFFRVRAQVKISSGTDANIRVKLVQYTTSADIANSYARVIYTDQTNQLKEGNAFLVAIVTVTAGWDSALLHAIRGGTGSPSFSTSLIGSGTNGATIAHYLKIA